PTRNRAHRLARGIRARRCARLRVGEVRPPSLLRERIVDQRHARVAKNNCDRMLTVEKTVIRFRPADVSCRSE
ncbi:MAG: hypothetical protein KBD58_00800, partial [Thermomonas sp.]|nr:hypothetical protein [Thermomonas sp.]